MPAGLRMTPQKMDANSADAAAMGYRGEEKLRKEDGDYVLHLIMLSPSSVANGDWTVLCATTHAMLPKVAGASFAANERYEHFGPLLCGNAASALPQ